VAKLPKRIGCFVGIARPQRIYHFTSHLWWRFIKDEGINRGECPLSETKVLNFPNFTSDPSPENQGWANRPKLAVRIEVSIPPNDGKLIPWLEFAKRYNVARKTIEALESSGGWGTDKNWWIYRGTVPPEWIVDVEILEHNVTPQVEKLLRASDCFATSKEMRDALMVPLKPGLPVTHFDMEKVEALLKQTELMAV
jgi:hypothetical protein